jgi:hypothetical protein
MCDPHSRCDLLVYLFVFVFFFPVRLLGPSILSFDIVF